MFQRVGIVSEGADAVSDAVLLDDDAFAVGQPAVADALLVKDFLRPGQAETAEVVGVVVSQVEVVEARLLEQRGVAFRHPEGIVVGLFGVFRAGAAFADHPFQVAGRQVRIEEKLFYVGEDVPSFVLRQADGGVGRPHHDVAAHGDGQQGIRCLGHGRDGGAAQQHQQGQERASHLRFFSFCIWAARCSFESGR